MLCVVHTPTLAEDRACTTCTPTQGRGRAVASRTRDMQRPRTPELPAAPDGLGYIHERVAVRTVVDLEAAGGSEATAGAARVLHEACRRPNRTAVLDDRLMCAACMVCIPGPSCMRHMAWKCSCTGGGGGGAGQPIDNWHALKH